MKQLVIAVLIAASLVAGLQVVTALTGKPAAVACDREPC